MSYGMAPFGSVPYSALPEAGASYFVDLGGVIGPTGIVLDTSGTPNFAILTGVIAPAGALRKRISSILAGAISPAGAMATIVLKGLVFIERTLLLSGGLALFITKGLSGTLSPVGNFIARKLRRPLKWLEGNGFTFWK